MGGGGGYLQAFLNSALNDSGEIHALAALPAGKRAADTLFGQEAWVDPWGGLEAVQMCQHHWQRQ
jgi:hypothetical protein